jgi:hypothetical protein
MKIKGMLNTNGLDYMVLFHERIFEVTTNPISTSSLKMVVTGSCKMLVHYITSEEPIS